MLDELRNAPPARLPLDILRAVTPKKQPIGVRAADSGMPTMTGYFSVFNVWYEVESWMEGHFLERVAPRAFAKTIAEFSDQMVVLFNHGMDPQIGDKALGPIESLAEDRVGPAYVVPLIDTDYNRELVPGLEAKLYGSSFRFKVIKDSWNMAPEPSDYNPTGLPERTIEEAQVFEFGPVTFPANPAAPSGLRSLTDRFYEHLRSRSPEQFEDTLRSVQTARTPAGSTTGAATPTGEPPTGTRRGMSTKDIAIARRQRAEMLATLEI